MIISLGHGNYIEKGLVAVTLQPESSHAKKLRKNAQDNGTLINATSGHKTRSVIVLTTNQVVLASCTTTTLAKRFNSTWNKEDDQYKRL